MAHGRGLLDLSPVYGEWSEPFSPFIEGQVIHRPLVC